MRGDEEFNGIASIGRAISAGDLSEDLHSWARLALELHSLESKDIQDPGSFDVDLFPESR